MSQGQTEHNKSIEVNAHNNQPTTPPPIKMLGGFSANISNITSITIFPPHFQIPYFSLRFINASSPPSRII